jgi:hypothetical protein
MSRIEIQNIMLHSLLRKYTTCNDYFNGQRLKKEMKKIKSPKIDIEVIICINMYIVWYMKNWKQKK